MRLEEGKKGRKRKLSGKGKQYIFKDFIYVKLFGIEIYMPF